MSAAHEIYYVTITPGAHSMEATARLAKFIINRWLPNNAGGAVMLAGPGLCKLLHPIFEKAHALNRPIKLKVDTTQGTQPTITEV